MTDTIGPLVESIVTTFATNILFDQCTAEQCETLHNELMSKLPNNEIKVVWDGTLKVYVKDNERYRCFETKFTNIPVQLGLE